MTRMTRTTWTKFAVLLIAAVALMLAGCGSDGDSGMVGPAGPPGEPPSEEEIAEIVEEVLEEDPPATDTSELEAAIDALTATVDELTAVPPTIPEILGGTKDSASAADLAAASAKVQGELMARFDHDMDESPVNLPDISAAGDVPNAATSPVTWASQVGGGGLFKDAGIGVDLSSPGDLATLKLGNLLTVDGVTLQKVTVSETDKVTVDGGEYTDAGGFVMTAAADTHTRTTVLGADGSEYIKVVNDVTGNTAWSRVTTFVGGNRIVEYNPPVTSIDDDGTVTDTVVPGAANVAATFTMADGRFRNFVTVGDANTYDQDQTDLEPARDGGEGSVAQDRNVALRGYANSTQAIAQDAAEGYGGWLADSFFLAYTLYSEQEGSRGDPDTKAYKSVWGGRTHASTRATNLSGFGESATWKGLMVGHDLDADKGATYGDLLKGNASLTARLDENSLTGSWEDGRNRVMDVSLTNIINTDGEDSRVPELHWTNLILLNSWAGGADGDLPVSFGKGSEISGAFYDGGNEVVGNFNKEDIVGVFGAVEYDMPAMDDMASGN